MYILGGGSVFRIHHTTKQRAYINTWWGVCTEKGDN